MTMRRSMLCWLPALLFPACQGLDADDRTSTSRRIETALDAALPTPDLLFPGVHLSPPPEPPEPIPLAYRPITERVAARESARFVLRVAITGAQAIEMSDRPSEWHISLVTEVTADILEQICGDTPETSSISFLVQGGQTAVHSGADEYFPDLGVGTEVVVILEDRVDGYYLIHGQLDVLRVIGDLFEDTGGHQITRSEVGSLCQ